MAILTQDAGPAPAPDPWTWPRRLSLGLLLVAPLVGVALIRLALFGWADAAPDDARYLNVGLAVLAGRGAVTPDGNIFLLRSPTYGIALALGARLVGGDPLVGGRIVAASLTLLGFSAAVRLGFLVRGLLGGAATAAAILATPLIWRLVPTLRIDLVQAAAVIGVILALRRPSSPRWAVAGALFGVSILVKETGMLVGLIPLAWLGLMPRRRWFRLAAVFAGAALTVAAWWWLFVWFRAGVVFPMNAIGVIERRDVAGALTVSVKSLPLVAALAVSWVVVARGIRRDIDVRLLVWTGIALVPPALYATANSLSTRNYAALALLSCIAAGIALTDVLSALRRHVPSGHLTRQPRIALAMAFIVVCAPAVGLGQLQVGRPGQSTLPDKVSGWLADRLAPGERVVMTFRMSGVVALGLGDRVHVAGLAANRVRADDDPSLYVWMGLRDRQLFGYRRAGWLATLGEPSSRYFVTVEPHPFAAIELLTILRSPTGPAIGVTSAADLSEGRDVAHIFELDPGRVRAEGPGLRLHLSAGSAQAWLTLAGGVDKGAAVKLADARAVVVGSVTEIGKLVAALGTGVCATSAGPDEPRGAVILGPC